MEEFGDWLRGELKKRGWQNVDLAHEANISDAQISRVVSGTRGAGPDFCVAIARGLGIDPVTVFRRAGLLPSADGANEEPSFADLTSVMQQLTPENREDVIAYAIWRRSQQIER